MLSCAHMLCRKCALVQVNKLAVCPICRRPVSKADIVSLNEQPDAPLNQPSFNFAKISRQAIKTGDDIPWRSSTKLDMLCDDIVSLRDHNRKAITHGAQLAPAEGPPEAPVEYCQTIGGMYIQGAVRVVVFSSFTFMLDLIERAFTNASIKFARFDGSLSQPQRESALRSFRTDSDTFVILMSLKAGGLGLNLTEASIVYLMDPWVGGKCHFRLSEVCC
jgi:SNF2 family DNA or RNA helicase